MVERGREIRGWATPARADDSGNRGRVDIVFGELERIEKRRTRTKERGTGDLRESEFALEKLGFAADDRQRAVLDSQAKRGILNCSRQWGKSTVLAVKAVHRAYTGPGVWCWWRVRRSGRAGSLCGRRRSFCAAGREAARGWGQRELVGAAEREPDCGVAGNGGDGAGIFGGIDAADRRSGAGAGCDV